MARPPIPMIGKNFGNLVVQYQESPDSSGELRWRCLCFCGNYRTVLGHKLRKLKVVDCGCRYGKPAEPRVKDHPLYSVWSSMLQRCRTNPNYSGRGISVSDDWLVFANFCRDMGDRPAGYSIERKNNDQGYCKENCKWASTKEQQHNRRTSIRYPYKGRLLTLEELAQESELSKETLRSRIVLYRWSVEDAMTLPKKSQTVRLARPEVVKLYPQDQNGGIL